MVFPVSGVPMSYVYAPERLGPPQPKFERSITGVSSFPPPRWHSNREYTGVMVLRKSAVTRVQPAAVHRSSTGLSRVFNGASTAVHKKKKK